MRRGERGRIGHRSGGKCVEGGGVIKDMWGGEEDNQLEGSVKGTQQWEMGTRCWWGWGAVVNFEVFV